MSAADLHRAAELERDEWGSEDTRRTYPKSSTVHLAVASLLDALAYRADDLSEASLSAFGDDEFGEQVARRSIAGYAEAHVLAAAIERGAS